MKDGTVIGKTGQHMSIEDRLKCHAPDAKLKAQRELAARTIDELAFGEQQPEQDHHVTSEKSRTGRFQDRSWRDAPDGGFFSAVLKVRPHAPQLLRCTYWGGDAGRRFSILIDGQLIATQKLDNSHPGKFFDADYPISDKLIGDHDSITVEFRPDAGSIAGGVFHCGVLLDQR